MNKGIIIYDSKTNLVHIVHYMNPIIERIRNHKPNRIQSNDIFEMKFSKN